MAPTVREKLADQETKHPKLGFLQTALRKTVSKRHLSQRTPEPIPGIELSLRMSMTCLDISNLQIGVLPVVVASCIQLQVLIADNTGLEYVPSFVSKELKSLRILSLSQNNIGFLPGHLALLFPTLSHVNLNHNPCLRLVYEETSSRLQSLCRIRSIKRGQPVGYTFPAEKIIDLLRDVFELETCKLLLRDTPQALKDLPSLQPSFEQRLCVAQELIQTERVFTENLRSCVHIYAPGAPLSAQALFINLRHMAVFHSEYLLPALSKAVHEDYSFSNNVSQACSVLSDSIAPKQEELSRINDVFRRFTPWFNVYLSYVTQLDQLDLSRFSPRFLESCKNHRRHTQLDLSAYLLLPIQRIPRYRLLLSQLGIEAFEIVDRLAFQMNERKRQSDFERALSSIQQKQWFRVLVPSFRHLVTCGFARWLQRVHAETGRGEHVGKDVCVVVTKRFLVVAEGNHMIACFLRRNIRITNVWHSVGWRIVAYDMHQVWYFTGMRKDLDKIMTK